MKLIKVYVEGAYEDWRASRACELCGRIRSIIVHRRKAPKGEWEESFARFCGGCEKIRRASVLHAQALRFLTAGIRELKSRKIPMGRIQAVMASTGAKDLIK